MFFESLFTKDNFISSDAWKAKMIFYVLFLLLLPQPNHGMGFMGIFQDLKLSKNSSADPCRAENLKVSFFQSTIPNSKVMIKYSESFHLQL